MTPNIVGIRFQRVGKIYHFDATNIHDLQSGDFVVVDTSRGTQMGQVVHPIKDPQRPSEGAWKPIQRKATARDLVLRQVWQQKEAEAVSVCRARVSEIKLLGVKIIGAEYSFDGSRLSFYVSSDEEDKVDLRDLRRLVQRSLPQTQIDFHQLGPRDVAKILGGMGACGLDNRCCSRFLTDFNPISIKMAKEQGISLTPTEITGMCGRLRCCLVYEYEQYVEARAQLPKRNKRVVTPAGEGKVIDVYPLSQRIVVLLDSGIQNEFDHADIKPYDELEALRQKAQQPCSQHPEGGCNCGQQAEKSTDDAPSSLQVVPSLEPGSETFEPGPRVKPGLPSKLEADTYREKAAPPRHSHPAPQRAAPQRDAPHTESRPDNAPGKRPRRRPNQPDRPTEPSADDRAMDQPSRRAEARPQPGDADKNHPRKKAGQAPGGKPNQARPRPEREKRKPNPAGKKRPPTSEGEAG